MAGGTTSESTQGTLVQSTSPWAALMAGQWGQQAASQAAQAAQQSTRDAINAINSQYNQSRYDLSPYRTTGVQALNQLNQYMGLEAYNPGAAPTAPTQKSGWDDLDIAKLRRQAMALAPEYGKDLLDYAASLGRDINTDVPLQNWLVSSLATNLARSGEKGLKDPTTYQFLNSYLGAGGTFSGGDGMASEIDIRNKAYEEAYGIDMEGYNRNLDEYNQNKAMYDKYSAEGPLTSQQISDKISALPGYQAQLDQGVNAIQKAAGAGGYLGSGRVLKELQNFGQNTLSQFYGDELSRLAGLVSQGSGAAQQTSQTSTNRGNALASLYSSLGENKANSYLAGGNAMANALIAANQNYNVYETGRSSSSSGGGLGGLGSIIGAGAKIYAASSKALKEDFRTLNTDQILKLVDNLDVEKWKYKDIDRDHIGPYAEQFSEFFGVGDGKTINMLDMMGVMMASIKELSKQVKTLKGE